MTDSKASKGRSNEGFGVPASQVKGFLAWADKGQSKAKLKKKRKAKVRKAKRRS